MSDKQRKPSSGDDEEAFPASAFDDPDSTHADDPDQVTVVFDGSRWQVEPAEPEHGEAEPPPPDTEVRIAVSRADDGWQAAELDP